MSLAPAPTLAQLAADPSKVATLESDQARALLLQASALVLALAARAGDSPNGNPEADRLLTVEEVAKKLGTSREWVYRRAAGLPFTVRLGSRLRFSAQGLDKYLRVHRQGR